MALTPAKSVLTCIDGSTYINSVCHHAYWIAQQLNCGVTLLHVQSSQFEPNADLSGALALDAHNALIEQLAQIDEARGKIEREKGKIVLDHAKNLLAGTSVPVATLHRWGALVDTLTELEALAHVIVIGKRGEQAQHATNYLGSNLERVVRSAHVPVLVAGPEFTAVRRIAIAYDGGLSAHKALDFIINHPMLHTCDIHLVMVDADVQQRQSGDVALARLHDRQIIAHLHHVNGRADEAITAFVRTHDIQLLLMGAYSHSPLRALFIGSTTTSILMNCPSSVLLFR
jgi:nucleotide-binding universal stress UspA family protein